MENLGQTRATTAENNNDFDLCGRILIVLSYILVVVTFPVAAFYCINVNLVVFRRC